MTLRLCDEISVKSWVVSCWNYYIEGDVVRAMVLRAAVFGCCSENCCVEGHSVGECGVGGCCEGRVYVKNVVGGIFGGLNGCYCVTR